MATHRKTEYADALLDQGASLQAVARRLAAGPLADQERLTLAFRLGQQALACGGLSEAIRRGERWPGPQALPLTG